MKGHLFEEQIENLYEVMIEVRVLESKLPTPSLHKAKCTAIRRRLENTVADLEEAILNYEEGITDDIDKTKKEILERLKRL